VPPHLYAAANQAYAGPAAPWPLPFQAGNRVEEVGGAAGPVSWRHSGR